MEHKIRKGNGGKHEILILHRVFFITVIEYNRHFSVWNCHLEVCYIVDRFLSDDSILCDNSKQRVSI